MLPKDDTWFCRTDVFFFFLSRQAKHPRVIEYGSSVKSESGLDTPVPEKATRPAPKASVDASPRLRSRKSIIKTASPSRRYSQRASRNQTPNITHAAVSEKLRRAVGRTTRSASASYLATPDASELPLPTCSERERPTRQLRSLQLGKPIEESGTSQTDTQYEAAASPTTSESNTTYSNAATPPITDADAEPFEDADESLQHSLRALHPPRPTINTVAAQDASLPSPRLSPTLQASHLHTAPGHDDVDDDDDDDADDEPSYSHQLIKRPGRRWMDDSQTTEDGDSLELVHADDSPARYHPQRSSASSQISILDTRSMLESFDSMPTEMKTFMMYQFLRRCPRNTLHMVADVVNPALKCDFLRQLPLELSLHVLSYLGYRDLCRAAQVSKQWRSIVDSNETGWKEQFDREGFELPPGELEKAIAQGWGWQDPLGPEGCELDLSMQGRLTSTETELIRSSSSTMTVARPEATQKLRSSKRKRGMTSYTSSERSKRRASAQEAPSAREEKASAAHVGVKLHKSEGPISAASAAALAVPDPHIGLPSLRKLHLFKSLYRRHHMIRQSWTSGKVKPSHVAFAAHPRHVITCLQFDEDKIITGSDDTLIHVYDTQTGKLRKKLEGHEGGVWALQYEGNTLVSGSTDRSVRVWDIEKGLCTQVFYGHTSTVRCLQILMPTETGRYQDGKPVMAPQKPLIITGSRDSQLRVWRLPEPGSRRYIQTGPPANDAECPYFIRILQGHAHSVRAISAHGDTLVSGSYDSTVRVWRISTGEALHVLHGHTQKVYSVVLDHERNRCISGSMDSLVKIWDLNTGACLHTLEGHSLLVGLLDLRDERLVSAAADSTLRIWDPESGKCKSTLTAHTGAITCFQHDGRKVISGSEKTVKMWDIHTGECIQDLLTNLSGVWQVKFDGRRCVAAVQRDNLTYVEVSFSLNNDQPFILLGRKNTR